MGRYSYRGRAAKKSKSVIAASRRGTSRAENYRALLIDTAYMQG